VKETADAVGKRGVTPSHGALASYLPVAGWKPPLPEVFSCLGVAGILQP